MEKLNFQLIDVNKLGWMFLNNNMGRAPPFLLIEQTMERYVQVYINLMIEMSERLNDESLNQVKNIGMTKQFCKDIILSAKCPLEIKNSTFQMFMKVHLTAKKRLSTFDDHSFCFEKLGSTNLLNFTFYWMNLNEIKPPSL